MVYKMAVFGPSGSGKTVLCKALAEQALGPIPGRGTHAPTAGCRVQEVLRNLNGTSLSIQLWDTGGGESFHRLAPVFAVHAIGLVLVYDARKANSSLKELSEMYETIMASVNMHPSLCLVVGVSVGSVAPDASISLPGALGQLNHVVVGIDPNGSDPHGDVQGVLGELDRVAMLAMQSRRQESAQQVVQASEF